VTDVHPPRDRLLSTIGVVTILRLNPEFTIAVTRTTLSAGRRGVPAPLLAIAVTVLLLCAGCGKAPDSKAAQDESAARQFSAEKATAAREREEMTRAREALEEANRKDIQKEAEETFKKFASERPVMTAGEETKAQEEVIERLRARMAEPAAMQVRNVYFNSQHTALCMEVNYREKGNYLGFRRAYSTPDVTWVEPNPDDVSHRVFMLNLQKMGCAASPAGGGKP
jgi:hypothetical protein